MDNRQLYIGGGETGEVRIKITQEMEEAGARLAGALGHTSQSTPTPPWHPPSLRGPEREILQICPEVPMRSPPPLKPFLLKRDS